MLGWTRPPRIPSPLRNSGTSVIGVMIPVSGGRCLPCCGGCGMEGCGDAWLAALTALAEESRTLSSVRLGLDADEFERPTNCPPWDLKELVAHTAASIGLRGDVSSPQPGASPAPHPDPGRGHAAGRLDGDPGDPGTAAGAVPAPVLPYERLPWHRQTGSVMTGVPRAPERCCPGRGRPRRSRRHPRR